MEAKIQASFPDISTVTGWVSQRLVGGDYVHHHSWMPVSGT